MAFIGGDLLSATYNHPTVGSGTIYFKSNESGTVNPGGFQTNDDANSVSGNGEMIRQMNRVLATVECPPVNWDMTDRNELFQLRSLSNNPVLADWTLEHINGAIFAGRGCPVGDLTGDTNTAQVTLKLAFENELKEIS